MKMEYTFILYFAAIALIYFPLLGVRRAERMSAGELTRQYPQFSWAPKSHSKMTAFVFAPLIIAVLLVIVFEDVLGVRYFVLIVPFICAFSVSNGIFALRTNILPLWATKYQLQFVYDPGQKWMWVSKTQIGLGILIAVLSIVLFFT